LPFWNLRRLADAGPRVDLSARWAKLQKLTDSTVSDAALQSQKLVVSTASRG